MDDKGVKVASLLCETRGHIGRRPCDFCQMQVQAALAESQRRVALEEAQWWHKRCCERVEVVGHPGVFQCFGCDRIMALDAQKGENG